MREDQPHTTRRAAGDVGRRRRCGAVYALKRLPLVRAVDVDWEHVSAGDGSDVCRRPPPPPFVKHAGVTRGLLLPPGADVAARVLAEARHHAADLGPPQRGLESGDRGRRSLVLLPPSAAMARAVLEGAVVEQYGLPGSPLSRANLSLRGLGGRIAGQLERPCVLSADRHSPLANPGSATVCVVLDPARVEQERARLRRGCHTTRQPSQIIRTGAVLLPVLPFEVIADTISLLSRGWLTVPPPSCSIHLSSRSAAGCSRTSITRSSTSPVAGRYPDSSGRDLS